MAVPTDGSYGIPKGLIYSFPVECSGDGKYKIVQGLKISEEGQRRLDVTTKELLEERKAVEHMLN
jgi:malate/lactate dehydrogenase